VGARPDTAEDQADLPDAFVGDKIMRGRFPAGPDYVDKLEGSASAKERLKIVLETIAGTCRVQEACERLGICEQRFHQLRQEALEAALAGLEPGIPGRRPHTPSPAEEQVRVLQEQLSQQELELRATTAREEIALTLPGVVHEPEKKTRGRPRKIPPRKIPLLPLGLRKNT
jgi:transposase-like protein